MSEPVVRISQGFFDPSSLETVTSALNEGRAELVPAIRRLNGLLHYFVSIDPVTNSMVNVSVWATLADAKQMDSLREMLAQRDVFVALGVEFQPIRNYAGLWSITP